MKHPPPLAPPLAWLLSLLCLACGSGPAPSASPPEPGERLQQGPPGAEAVALTVTGFTFTGTDATDPALPGIESAKWNGTGFWISNDLLVTNAHVAARASRVEAKDEAGRRYIFDHIVALAPEVDTALLRMKPPDPESKQTPTLTRPLATPLLPQPTDPRRALRHKPVLSAGNVWGMGLSYIRGRVADVVLLPIGSDAERIAIRGLSGPGASGGPVYADDGSVIVGVTHAGRNDHTLSLAIPSWRVSALVERHFTQPGVPLDAAFTARRSDPPLARFDAERAVCLEAGRSLRFDVEALGAADLVLNLRATDAEHAVTPAGSLGEVAYLIARKLPNGRGELLARWQGTVEGPRLLAARSLSADGHYTVMVANPSSETRCLHAGVGRVQWEERI